ncbi:hypothetical protein [Streptomyces alanosinicus]|uniref:Uncharacterized protein n=1 Tax=Streptomyces alanosinicus TaxID=68171 RepID=A0A918YT75_9ACTN|nr:hypothetical protein [Streptomyces alanosinicus]GHE16003.1 hypothetical protein GCM10010339_92470 [Streptomyces alanosinicus]
MRGLLYERRQWQTGGWMYWVGIPMWVTDGPTETVQPRVYRVWLTPAQVSRPEGVSYDDVPTHHLPREDQGDDSGRWGWKVQRLPPRSGKPDAPAGNEELDVLAVLEVLRTTAGAVPCKECDAAVALGPLL